jgi:hypothetical protein
MSQFLFLVGLDKRNFQSSKWDEQLFANFIYIWPSVHSNWSLTCIIRIFYYRHSINEQNYTFLCCREILKTKLQPKTIIRVKGDDDFILEKEENRMRC